HTLSRVPLRSLPFPSTTLSRSGVDDDERVELDAAASKLVDRPRERGALPRRPVVSLEARHAAAPGHLGRAILATVGDDGDAETEIGRASCRARASASADGGVAG